MFKSNQKEETTKNTRCLLFKMFLRAYLYTITISVFKLNSLEAVCPPSHLTGLSGTIASPNFPDFYPVNIQCTTNITAPQGYRIEITFSVVDIQYHANCTKDSVTVLTEQYYGFLICGKPTLPLAYMVSQDNTMIVDFKSDGSETHQGYKAHYKAVPKPGPKLKQDQLSSSFVPVPNRSLSGYILKKINTSSNIACAMLCQRNALCKSVTYETSFQSTGGLCILHSIEGTPDSLSEESNAVYYRLLT